MSGGVDSSVAASLLKEQGFQVVGVFMKPWQPKGAVCNWRQDREDALRVATMLDIPLLTWDFAKEYEREVATPMFRGYEQGITPNPDVECNRHIKFGFFFERAISEGADFVATGHYARIASKDGRKWISAAEDDGKDQTYFLWGIRPACLERTLFPVGEMTKPDVRRYAKRKGLLVADKRDSQGVCFVGPIPFRDFLRSRISHTSGDVVDTTGRVLGTHDGAALYTIGQRHGMGLSGGDGPWYVVRKDISRNRITVGSEQELYGDRIRLTNTNWFGSRPRVGETVTVKIRYRTRAVRARVQARGVLAFSRPVRAISPGQSAVIYRGNRVLGGGIIT